MAIRRVFLDWSEPALPSAARYLVERFSGDGAEGRSSSTQGASSPGVSRLDLSRVVVATPGGRAGRRLLEVLVDEAESRGLEFVPPRIITTGVLPELLYPAKKPFADSLTQHLAWVAALKAMSAEKFSRLARSRPEESDLFGWLALAEMLASVHRELAADGLDCHDVVWHGQWLAGFRDAGRWKLLAEIQERYLRELDALELWDVQTARLFAIKHEECRLDGEIVLVGAVDMNLAQRKMLDLVADRVTSLVFAPESLADRFDEHGCVVPASWMEASVPLSLEQIDVVDRPGDQAETVVGAIASFDGRYPAEDVVIGVPDERLVPYLEQRLEECELPGRYGAGKPVLQSEACLLLTAVSEWLDTGRFEAFANLLRHPALERWLLSEGVSGDCLTALDEFHDRRLPSGLSKSAITAAARSVRAEDATMKGHFERLGAAWEKVGELVGPLRSGKKPLGEWGAAIVGLLTTVYGGRPLNSEEAGERTIIASCRAVHEVLAIHKSVPSALSPSVSGGEALRFTLAELAGVTSPPPAEEAAIEMLGWLELPLDDAPALIVTGVNERIVPSSRNADQFLPNELRRHLNLEDNDRRFARDVYALSVLAASREELRLIAGRRTAEGDPLVPSRLLFACDAEETARRARAWFGERGEPERSQARGVGLDPRYAPKGGARAKAFAPPHPDVVRELLKATRGEMEVASMRVTEFRDYLACPYRYFLRHRLRLGRKSDAAREMEGPHFGKLLHEVLDHFGRTCVRDPGFAATTNALEIEETLFGALDDLAGRWFGNEPHPAVRIQVELIRRRLKRFAAWQAQWAREGWRIRYVEHDIPHDKAVLEIPGGPMPLHGRIDRIDVREGSGETVVFDYKTGDAGLDPEKTHRDKGSDSWKDLQLPLYRYACQWLEVERDVQVGYVVLPKREEDIGHRLAKWDAELFEGAVREAERIAQAVREGRFWPPASEPPGTFEELAAICGDYRFAGAPEEEPFGSGGT